MARYPLRAPLCALADRRRDGVLCVDLEGDLWTDARPCWDERAPGVWDIMERAFLGASPPVSVNSAPRLDCTFGSVTVAHGRVSARFGSIWSSPESFLPEGIPKRFLEDALREVSDWLFAEHGAWDAGRRYPIGAVVSRRFRAHDFIDAMRSVSRMYGDVERSEHERNARFEEFVAFLLEKYRGGP